MTIRAVRTVCTSVLMITLALAGAPSSAAVVVEQGYRASRPPAAKFQKHLDHHVSYPATRSDIMQACRSLEEFTKEEQLWIAQKLPNARYRGPEEVFAAIAKEGRDGQRAGGPSR